MATTNIRRPPPEVYDPKQRVVGGIVLTLILLLIYLILKTLLGISSTGAAYALRAPLPDEVAREAGRALPGEEPPAAGGPATPYPIATSFAFLDLNGKPMQEGALPTEQISDGALGDAAKGKRWAVQAASFREKDRADRFVQQLRDKGFESSVNKSGDWYAVRLLPQTERRVAEQQLLTLRQKTGKKGMLVELN